MSQPNQAGQQEVQRVEAWYVDFLKNSSHLDGQLVPHSLPLSIQERLYNHLEGVITKQARIFVVRGKTSFSMLSVEEQHLFETVVKADAIRFLEELRKNPASV